MTDRLELLRNRRPILRKLAGQVRELTGERVADRTHCETREQDGTDNRQRPTEAPALKTRRHRRQKETQQNCQRQRDENFTKPEQGPNDKSKRKQPACPLHDGWLRRRNLHGSQYIALASLKTRTFFAG